MPPKSTISPKSGMVLWYYLGVNKIKEKTTVPDLILNVNVFTHMYKQYMPL